MHGGKMRNSRGRKGFILSHALLSLLAACLFVPLCADCIRLLALRKKFDQQIQDEIALSQLRHILNAAGSIESDGNSLQFTRKYEPAELYLTNRHLILSPGTQIYLEDIDGAEFYYEMHTWMIRYEREGELFEKPLIHE